MVVLLVLFAFVIMLVIDVLFIYPKQKIEKKVTYHDLKPEIFYTPEVGFTMCDGGELIKKEEPKKEDEKD